MKHGETIVSEEGSVYFHGDTFDGAFIRPATDSEKAFLSPFSPPRIFYDPKRNAGFLLRSIPDDQNDVICQFERVESRGSNGGGMGRVLHAMIDASVVMNKVRVDLKADGDGTAFHERFAHARLVGSAVKSADVTIVR